MCILKFFLLTIFYNIFLIFHCHLSVLTSNHFSWILSCIFPKYSNLLVAFSITNTICCECSIKTADDGQYICQKHVEYYIKIKLRNIACCWLLLYQHITMHSPQKVKLK